jgi:hypothetical protein
VSRAEVARGSPCHDDEVCVGALGGLQECVGKTPEVEGLVDAGAASKWRATHAQAPALEQPLNAAGSVLGEATSEAWLANFPAPKAMNTAPAQA